MAREIGVFDMPANFEGAKAAPLDARQVCGTIADREALTYTYKGMMCIVIEVIVVLRIDKIHLIEQSDDRTPSIY